MLRNDANVAIIDLQSANLARKRAQKVLKESIEFLDKE